MLKALSSTILIVSLICASIAGGAGVMCQPPEETAQPTPKLDPKSNPLALLHQAYRDSGYTPEQAITIAHVSLGIEYDTGVPIPIASEVDEDAVLMDPRSNPLAILYELFLKSGYSVDEASRIAHAALGLEEELQSCGAYVVKIRYCSGGQDIILNGFMNSRCFDDPDGDPATNDGLSLCDSCMCLPPDKWRWLSLTVAAGGACPILPAAGTCVSMRVVPGKIAVNCSQLDIECACFVETNPVNCAAIECCCCPNENTGCEACPSCTGCP